MPKGYILVLFWLYRTSSPFVLFPCIWCTWVGRYSIYTLPRSGNKQLEHVETLTGKFMGKLGAR